MELNILICIVYTKMNCLGKLEYIDKGIVDRYTLNRQNILKSKNIS